MHPLKLRLVVALALTLCSALPHAAVAAAADWPIAQGRFFTQTGSSSGERGYGITNRDGVRFWDAFQSLGGVQAVGYPVSGRFVHQGFVTQVMQKAVFQWRPELGSVNLVNVFDDLGRADKNDWLYSVRSTPRPLPPELDDGKEWSTVVRDRTALLDARAALRARYFAVSDPMLRYGLPTSRVEDMGNHYAIRLQRAVIQEWKIDVPWARAGEVTVANGGDIMKEAGLVPFEAAQPEVPPSPSESIVASGAAPVDGRIVAEATPLRRTPGGAEYAWVFRNATVELAGPAIEAPGGPWQPVRLWNALAGWLPRSALTTDAFPAQDKAPGTPYRRTIPPAPAASVPVPIDVAATAARASALLAEPGGRMIGAVSTGQPLRLIGYARAPLGTIELRVWDGAQYGWLAAQAVKVSARDPLARLSSGSSPWAVVSGKGMWSTYDLLDRTSADAIVETARANGISHVYLQVARSNLGFYGARGLDQLLPAAHAAGINVVGWVYPFLKDVVADVRMTNEATGYTTPDGHRIDALAADVEENVAVDDVHVYGQLMRGLVGDDLPLIVATYPPDMERGRTYPFAVVAQTWNVIAPMDYYHRPGRAWTAEEAYGYVARSVQMIRERAGRPVAIQPIGQAYAISWPNEIGPTNPSGDETQAMLRAARETGTVGISFFEWSHTTAAQWREIGAYPW